ncbi:MAG: porin family protein [Tannerellaceae bacterium]|jgi:hypothetical protein|nr:porin family protein [Tannerellaceae bacterium]
MKTIKKLHLIIVLIALVNVSMLRSQNAPTTQTTPTVEVFPKGYIGLSIGGASLTKDISNASGGIQANINFGYLFTEHVGIAATAFATSYKLSNYDNATVGLSGTLVGPLFSTLSGNGAIQFDFRPAIGLAQGTVTVGSVSGNTDDFVFAAGAGASVRWNCSRKISLSANFDYFSGKPDDVDLSSYGLTVGINYRLK